LIHPLLARPVSELANRLNGCNFFPDPDKPKLISIAGIIGVGKTTLTEKLSEHFNGEMILEKYSSNPFMQKVYQGQKKLALDSEVYFLTNRVMQLDPNSLSPEKIYISDYILEKGMVYQNVWLDKNQQILFEKIHPVLAADVTKPALIIHMADTPENCLKRIHSRNRPYEQKIQPQFLKALAKGYDDIFKNWKNSPIIKIDIPKFDCMKKQDIENLANQIKYYLQ